MLQKVMLIQGLPLGIYLTTLALQVFSDNITACRCESILSYFHVLEFTQTRKMVPKMYEICQMAEDSHYCL